MTLPQSDVTCLLERGVQYSVAAEANMTCLVIQGYALPPGYDRPQADLLLRLSPGFPDVPPDMWWFDPIKHRDEVEAPLTDWLREAYELSDVLASKGKARAKSKHKPKARRVQDYLLAGLRADIVVEGIESYFPDL